MTATVDSRGGVRVTAADIPIEGLPAGLRPVRFGVPAAGERVWDGELRTAHAGWAVSVLIVEVLPGYDLLYDVCRDRWQLAKEAPPFPRPETGDWLDFAGELLHSLVQTPCRHAPELFPPWLIADLGKPGAMVRRASAVLTFAATTREEVLASIRQAVTEMAAELNSQPVETILTGDLPVPQGVREARAEVRRGVAMRYVLARDIERGWVLRFDVLYQIQPKETNE